MSLFSIERTSPDRLDIEFGGKLDSDDMQRALDELMQKAAGMSRAKMLFRVRNYELPTLGAMAVEFSRMFEMLRWLRRFDRAAVIADQTWIRKISEIEGALIPGLEIRAFSYAEEAEAAAWLDSQSDI